MRDPSPSWTGVGAQPGDCTAIPSRRLAARVSRARAVVEGEGFAVADIDISEAIVLKEAHDIIGRYNRFDVFQLRVNQTRIKPVRLFETATTFEDYVPSPCDYEELTDEDEAAMAAKRRIRPTVVER